MKCKLHVYVFLFLLAVCGHAYAQDDCCANSKSPRIGVFILSAEPVKSDLHLDDYLKRAHDVEKQFREVLVKELPRVCIVRDVDIFSDPKNCPTLKGSMIFTISAHPSFKNTKVSALAIEMQTVEGASFLKSKSYYRRFGCPMINRVKMSMINEGLLHQVKEETVEELPNGRTKSRPGKKSDFVLLLSRAK